MFTAEDRSFIRAILANPAELTAWLVYADWLDERDDPRAEFIRLEVKRTAHDTTQTERFGIIAQLEDLRPKLDQDWVAIFDRPRVENCDEQFAFKCPKQWVKLKGTDDPTVRYCDSCQKDVYYCHTLRDAFEHAQNGDCVAVSEAMSRSEGDLHRDPDDPPPVRFIGLMSRLEPEPEPPRPWWKFW